MSLDSDYWYLLFMETDQDFFLKPLLKPGFRHVMAVKPDRDRYLVVENHYRDSEVYTLTDIQGLLDKSVCVKVYYQGGARGLFMLDTCVATTKQMLGINKPFIWTPWQLHQYVTRLNDEQKKRQKGI